MIGGVVQLPCEERLRGLAVQLGKEMMGEGGKHDGGLWNREWCGESWQGGVIYPFTWRKNRGSLSEVGGQQV